MEQCVSAAVCSTVTAPDAQKPCVGTRASDGSSAVHSAVVVDASYSLNPKHAVHAVLIDDMQLYTVCAPKNTAHSIDLPAHQCLCCAFIPSDPVPVVLMLTGICLTGCT